MTYYGVSYLPPTSSSATFDSSSFNRANEALTYQTALDNFLAYPTAQGTENLKTTNVGGLLTLTNDLIINGPTGASANYIQFTDGSQQSTAFVEANYAQLNTNNRMSESTSLLCHCFVGLVHNRGPRRSG